MISLPKLLLEAAGRKASEVQLDVGQRPILTTPSGRESIGETLGESDLFEALSGVLGPEQQAELAVGNAVEFRLSTRTGEWTMLVEPSLDGMTVRGRRGTGEMPAKHDADVGTPMELPPLAPFQPESAEAPAPEPVLKRRTQFDLGLSTYAEEDPTWGDDEPSVPPPPVSSGVLEERRSPLPPPPPVGDLGPERASGVDFAIVPEAVDAAGAPEPIEVDSDVALDVSVGRSNGPSGAFDPEGIADVPRPADRFRSVGRAGGSSRSTSGSSTTSGSSSTRDDVAPLVDRLVAGTMCFASEGGLAEHVAKAGTASVTILDERSAVDLAGRMLSELELGATYLVQLEDPSRIAAWLLRRVEEGSRVIIETRARDLAGAKRMFVGLHGEPAERWLAAHEVLWLADEGGTWQMTADDDPAARAAARPQA